MQSRRWSFIESVANVAIGYGIAIATQVVVFPWFGLQVRLADNMKIGGIFTIVSIARSYTVRRAFNLISGRG